MPTYGRLAAVVLALALLGAPLAARAQSAVQTPRIGVPLVGGAACKPTPVQEAFFQGLRDLGYVPGKNIAFDIECYTTADGMRASLAELVKRKVDVIFVGAPASAIAARNLTREIPIVCASCGDPLDNGLVASLARPGGNFTGMASLSAELIGKRLALLTELVPGISRVVALINPDNPGTRPTLKAFDDYGPKLGLEIVRVEFRKIADFRNAIQAAATARLGAVLIQDDPFTFSGRNELGELVLKHRLVASAGQLEMVEAGVLMAYGPNRGDLARGAAGYVDKIFKGAKPADLPIQQPTRLDLVINLKTAKALGITVPQSVLIRADRVIE